MSDLRYNAAVPVLPDVTYWHRVYRTSVLRYFYSDKVSLCDWSMWSTPVSSAFVRFPAGQFVQFSAAQLSHGLMKVQNQMP